MIRPNRLRTFVIGISCLGMCRAQDSGWIKVVKGSPFSAQTVTESTQTLSDGNHIVQNNTAIIARDSEGRTRREQSLPGSGNSSVVFIQDPIAGFSYVLLPVSRWAIRIANPTVEPGTTPSSSDLDVKSESLGTQSIEGVQADGTRIIRTLQTQQSGNELPLAVILETWYSSDLQTLILKKTIDPRLGETTITLKNIQRAEPDQSLFEIPKNYKIQDAPQNEQ